MKKIFLNLIVIASLCLGTTVTFAKCEKGTEITGTINNHKYCKSNIATNWWTAFAWCKYQGRELATLEQACPNWQDAGGSTLFCNNLKNAFENSYIWTANPSQSDYVYIVSASGNISFQPSDYTRRSTAWASYALCY